MCLLKYQNAWREEMSHALCGCVLQVCSMIQSAGSRQMPIYLATLDPCASSMPLEAICFNLVGHGDTKGTLECSESLLGGLAQKAGR